MMRAISSLQALNSIATTASEISSEAKRANDMYAEDAVGLASASIFDEADCGVHAMRAAIGGKRERALLVIHAVGLQLLLGLADPGDFRLV